MAPFLHTTVTSAHSCGGPSLPNRLSRHVCRSGVHNAGELSPSSTHHGPRRTWLVSNTDRVRVRDFDTLVETAKRHGGLVTRRQAVAAGVAGRTLTDLVRTGALARVARGVYAVGSRL